VSDHLPGRPEPGRPRPPTPAPPPRRSEDGLPRFLRGGVPALSSAPLSVQRSPAGVAPEEAAAPDASRTPVPGLIVEDDAAALAPGQMRRSEFLALLRAEVCETAEDALRGTLWSSMGCPYVERWFGYYAGQSAEHVERALRRYVPEATGAASAGDYVPLAAARVRAAIAQWTGDPDAPALPAEPAGDGGGLFASLARMLFKARDGGARPASPEAVRAGLGAGRSLDPGIAARMGAAFGRDFSGVRVHTGAGGESAAERMNARAFTVGEHVAFGAGEYRPGTPAGDALIAHELAHVVQQGGGAGGGGAVSEAALEDEADRAAVGAVVGGAAGGWMGMAALLPRLRTGLRLSRCSKSEQPNPTGVHYDQAVSRWTSGTPSLPGAIPGLTHNERATRDEVITNLTTMDAGGSYVFFGHGAQDPADRRFKGINPSSGRTVMGEHIEEALGKDANPPTLVVLGACGSGAILSHVTAGGVPVAVGFSQEISNSAAASAVGVFMKQLHAGSTFEEARAAAQEMASRLIGAEIILRYGDGYHGGMTLEDARSKHQAEVGVP
jgi:hypothetical protein